MTSLWLKNLCKSVQSVLSAFQNKIVKYYPIIYLYTSILHYEF
jgi:hypothetical protein